MYNPPPIMSANPFPAQIDPFKWAELGFYWQGDVPLARFQRLQAETVEGSLSPLVVEARLSFDERKIAWLDATIKGEVSLECQRCMQPKQEPLDLSVRLALLPDDYKVSRLDEFEDYILLEESEAASGNLEQFGLDILAVLEDEILLNLPIVPRHDSCAPPVHLEAQAAPVTTERPNPFAVLADLKKNL